MIIQAESINEARAAGLEDLQRAHWREVAVDPGAIPLVVDWQRYLELEEKKIFFALTMRDGSRLCGYNAFFVMPHLHYMTTVFAVNDVVYLAPEYRGLDGVRFILEAEKRLRSQDVRKVLYHSKEDVEFAMATRGRGSMDSLDVLDRILELEDEYEVSIPEWIGADDLTFGGLLVRLGYAKEESTYGKLLGKI